MPVRPVVYPQGPNPLEHMQVDAAIEHLLAEGTNSTEGSTVESTPRCSPASPTKPVCSPPVDPLPMPPRDGPCKQWSSPSAPLRPNLQNALDDLHQPWPEHESPQGEDMPPHIRTVCLQQQQLERRFEAWMFQLTDYLQHRLPQDVAERVNHSHGRSVVRLSGNSVASKNKSKRGLNRGSRGTIKTPQRSLVGTHAGASNTVEEPSHALKPLMPLQEADAVPMRSGITSVQSSSSVTLASRTLTGTPLGKDTGILSECDPAAGFANGGSVAESVPRLSAEERRRESIEEVDTELQELREKMEEVVAPAVKREKMRSSIRSKRQSRSSRHSSVRSKKASTLFDDQVTKLQSMVAHWSFDVLCGTVIFANSLLIGVVTELSYESEEEPLWMVFAGHLCNFFFLVELILRAYAAGKLYYRNEDKYWNMFDTILVAFSFVDIVMEIMDREEASSIGSVMKTVKMFRIVRVFRVFRFFRELSLLAIMIADSLRSLIWALLMLAIIIYVFAILFSAAAANHLRSTAAPADERIGVMFGSVLKTVYYLVLSMMNGISWGEVCSTLMKVDVFSTIFFFFYVAFTILAVLNIITGVFVDNAVETAKTQRDWMVAREMELREKYVQDLRDLFHAMDDDGSGTVTWEEMDDHFSDTRVRGYFTTLGLEVDDMKRLFMLIDDDNSGEVEVDEFLDGCLRLKGEARSIDVHTVLHECRKLGHRLDEVIGPRDRGSHSLAQYHSFGNVITRDTTKTNGALGN